MKLITLTLLSVAFFVGCASQTTTPQQDQFRQSVAFWSGEVTTLRHAVETLPPGAQRDKAVKDLQAAEYWMAFFNSLTNPPTTQPVK